MKQSQLRQIIKEEVEAVLVNTKADHYMFFENLKIIKDNVDKLLQMDKMNIETLLSNGHDWAADHISTSKDDVEEVYNFFMTKKAQVVGVEENETSDLKVGDKVKYNNQEWEVEKFLDNRTVRLKHSKGLPSTNVMPSRVVKLQEKKLSSKQMQIAKVAPPADKITGADFAALRKK